MSWGSSRITFAALRGYFYYLKLLINSSLLHCFPLILPWPNSKPLQPLLYHHLKYWMPITSHNLPWQTLLTIPNYDQLLIKSFYPAHFTYNSEKGKIYSPGLYVNLPYISVIGLFFPSMGKLRVCVFVCGQVGMQVGKQVTSHISFPSLLHISCFF